MKWVQGEGLENGASYKRNIKENEEKFAKAFHNSPSFMLMNEVEGGTIIEVNTDFAISPNIPGRICWAGRSLGWASSMRTTGRKAPPAPKNRLNHPSRASIPD